MIIRLSDKHNNEQRRRYEKLTPGRHKSCKCTHTPSPDLEICGISLEAVKVFVNYSESQSVTQWVMAPSKRKSGQLTAKCDLSVCVRYSVGERPQNCLLRTLCSKPNLTFNIVRYGSLQPHLRKSLSCKSALINHFENTLNKIKGAKSKLCVNDHTMKLRTIPVY